MVQRRFRPCLDIRGEVGKAQFELADHSLEQGVNGCCDEFLAGSEMVQVRTVGDLRGQSVID